MKFLFFFTDIVIGAPYERNREGAIYIYNLGHNGFPANFSQKISGESVSHGQEMKGFGISVSRAVDINDDSYPGKLFVSLCLCEIKTDKELIWRILFSLRISLVLLTLTLKKKTLY